MRNLVVPIFSRLKSRNVTRYTVWVNHRNYEFSDLKEAENFARLWKCQVTKVVNETRK